MEDHRKGCDQVTLDAVHTCRFCMPYENDLPIYIYRGLRLSMADVWEEERSFD